MIILDNSKDFGPWMRQFVQKRLKRRPRSVLTALKRYFYEYMYICLLILLLYAAKRLYIWFTGRSRIVPDRTESSWIVLDHPGSSWIIPDRPGSSRFIPDRPGSSRIVPDRPGSSRIVSNHPESSRIVPVIFPYIRASGKIRDPGPSVKFQIYYDRK